MSRFKRKTAAVIDLTGSDDDGDTIHVAPRKKQKRSHSKRVMYLTSDDENAYPSPPKSKTSSAAPREVFRELSSKEYQEKLKQPKAWVKGGVAWRPANKPLKQEPASAPSKKQIKTKTPIAESGSIRDYLSKLSNESAHHVEVKKTSATTSASAPRSGVSHHSAPDLPRSKDKPARHSARNAFSLIMQQHDSHSEDELNISQTTGSTPGIRRAKQKRKAPVEKADDSDFEANSSSGSEVVSEDDGLPAESSDSEHTAEDEPQVKKVPKKAKQSVPRAASNAAKGKAKAGGQGRKRAQNMVNLSRPQHGQGTGLLPSLPPLSDTREIFDDIVGKALPLGLSQALDDLPGSLRVATMCSGTESPLLALELFQQCLGSSKLEIEHLFSAEIVPFKQAYIERNFRPPIIFRDITEMTSAVNDEIPSATTAYGSKVPIPRNVDLLIAGTSCVDYSRLNSHQKSVDQGGESGDTYTAVLAYCTAFRPSIVLLENVLTAPWDRMLEDYQKIGYETGGVLVDTKGYYLPQTRQRGYMVCFDKHEGASLSGAGKRWTDLMADFRRPASSPASSFLLPTSLAAKQRQAKEDEQRTREVDWTRCELRHTQLRHDLRLGNERPITHWSESGSLIVPEGGDPAWYARMVERVWDLLDISVLRKALPSHGFYDARYKTRIWDVSQNVDFQKDSGAFGIIGCITPTMIPFLSDAGRVLTPEEMLRLQGLPLDKISFTTELPANIQDLAGNAMSTTVVGPAILAALIAGHRAIQRPEKLIKDATLQLQKTNVAVLTAKMESVPRSNATASIDVTQLLLKSKQATRRCICEAAGKLSAKPIQKCICCGHTACLTCAGNPEHQYRQDPMLSKNRITASDFEAFLNQTLPLSLNFSFEDAWHHIVPEAHYREKVDAIGHQFHFQSFRQTHCWTATYTGNCGHLDLVLNGDLAEWRLFADIPKDLSYDSPRRTELEAPIAIGKIVTNFFGDEWSIRIPEVRHVDLDIKESGSRKASWWARNGMLDFAGHTVPEYLEIRVQDDSLSVIEGSDNYNPQEPLFLFLDPTRTGNTDQDSFVFARNIEHIDYHEQRLIVARIAATWRPWSRPDRKRSAPTLVVRDSFEVKPQCHLSATGSSLEIFRLKNPETSIGHADCTQAVQLLRAIQANSSISDTDLASAAARSQFLSQHQWVLEAMGRCFPSDSWRPIFASTRQCERCAPSRPKVRWAMQSGGEVSPYEDVPSAAEYEQAMKTRPDPVMLAVTYNGETGFKLSLSVNMMTLAHRAAARLPVDAENVQLSWRLIHRPDCTPFVFKKFHLSSNEDTTAFDGNAELSIDLFHQQQQSLAWMIRQEHGIPFAVEESEEFRSETGWLAQVQARGDVTVRGGICADHPGFGKTITSLALIQSQSKMRKETIADLETRAPKGLKTTAATLIVYPASLVQQWVDEIRDKIGSLTGVIAIPAAAQLARYTIQKFQEAKIIVVNRDVLTHEAYIDRIASFAAVPGPVATKGRALTEWRAHALRQIPEHLAILARGGLSRLRTHIKCRYDENVSSDEFQAAVPSRRHRGQDYVDNKKKKLTATQVTQQAAPRTIDVSSVDQPLFEMFFFNRLIVDEFHDYTPKVYAATSALKADKRWGLSGTPAIEDFYQVAQMAQLLGLDLPMGSMDAAVMKNSSRQALQKDMSSFEQFDSMWRQLPSSTKYRSIHALHQRFLATFARQNIGDFGKMEYGDHLVPVELDVEHRLLYTELSQHLNTLQMRIKATGKSKATDRNRRLNEAVSTSITAEEALSKAAAFVDQTSEPGDCSILDDLMDSCSRHIATLRDEIQTVAHHARDKEAERYQKWYTQMLDEGGLPDSSTVSEVVELINAASVRAHKKKDGKGAEEDAVTHKLSTLCTRLLMERRSLRYLAAAKQLQDDAREQVSANRCENSACEKRQPSQYALSAVCGHLICEACHERNKHHAATNCLAVGCSNPVQAHHLLWTSKIGNLKRTKPSAYGAKLEAAIVLLKEIQGKAEQAILFVQFEQQLQQVDTALKHCGISRIVVHSANDAGSQLKAFRDCANTKDKKTVIVLNAADETAAGSNLQNANHVIFLSPLLQRTQYKYDSTMAQAIGRVRRFGQERPIHVYRIVALDTIDVDVLEHRENRADALVEQGQKKIEPPTRSKELNTLSKKKPERTQLVREKGHFSLRPQSWLIDYEAGMDAGEVEKVKGKSRVLGWEDFSSLVKFSTKYTEDDE
ncbi:hypothetical protein CB0940_10123 [Cercospora beticola]|uniref:Helicase C-terminal domain-containing protein n=2 Tax=Cercospora beticola TaxID=122368 RepID=A0A2G5HT11_CERBT|nr:hypothetical protein CB0940_10123 [Cercospora beticola]PIA95671.1 hypothetical protein CB0940_10123 [Cercospora beticola]